MKTNDLTVTEAIQNLHVEIQMIEYQAIHYHPEMEIILVLKGEPTFTINGAQQKYQPQDIIVINPHDSHAIISNIEPSTLLILYLNPEFFKGYFPQMNSLRLISNKLISQNKELFLYTFLSLAKTYAKKEPFYQISCASYLNIMMHDILLGFKIYEANPDDYSIKSINDERILNIIRYIQTHYSEKISIQELAEELNLSVSYLSYFIKKNLNQSFTQFLTYIRYVNAKRMIHEKEFTLVEISEMTGFSDYRYMNQAFQKFLNKTPNEYKNSILQKPPSNTKEKVNIRSTKEEMLETIDLFMRLYHLDRY